MSSSSDITRRAPTHPSARVRVGDVERAAAAERLSAHAAAGRLSIEELEERLERVHAAVVAGDLLSIEADLPAPARSSRAPRRVLLSAVAIACVVVGVLATLAIGHPIAPPLIAAVLLWRANAWRGHEHSPHTHLIEQRSVT